MAEAAEASESFFGWLDYDERDAQRMREVFAAFDDKDTVDSLGLGVIRDAISDQLFPGISTIQTRARYFFFVPWLCKMLEQEAVPAAQFGKRLRDLEVALIESLRATEGPNQGVIGYRARRKLERLPSTVYWNGLQVFGLRLLNLTIPEYRGAIQRLAAWGVLAERDDDGELVARPRRMWDADLPTAPPGFPDEPVSLLLTAAESEYLTGRIAAHCPDTLMSELAMDLTIDRSVAAPWQVTLPSFSPRLSELLRHSRNFAELMEGAQALYNLLIARRAERLLDRDTSELQGRLSDELDEWEATMDRRRAELTSWIRGEEFWYFVERSSRVPTRTRRFVLAWADLALADPTEIRDDTGAAALITEREYQLKGKLARLTEQRALENWNGQPFAFGQLTFRWTNARRILDDLQAHEGTVDAES